MSSSSEDSSPTDLASRKSEATRNVIRDATQQILATGHAATLSMPAVADRAGMSVRTLYRYFPSKQALLDDVAMVFARRVEDMMTAESMSQDPYSYLPMLWSEFYSEIDVVRSQHRTTIGDDLRARRLEAMRSVVTDILKSALKTEGASQGDLAVLRDLAVAVTSSSMFLELVDRQGLDPRPAAQYALWVTEAMREKFDADGGISL